MRGVSTLPDVALFLVLVSGAVGTLAVVPVSAPTDGFADETARTLTTTTVTVAEGGNGRTVHGTPAGLLAVAALDRVTLDTRRLLPPGASVPRPGVGVLDGVRRGRPVHVRAVWRPYRNASLVGEVTVGSRPPRSASVDAAVVRVPTGLPGERAARRAARRDGFGGLARLLARALVDRAFPPEGTRTALYDPRTRDERLARYRYVAAVVGSRSVAAPLSSVNATAANRRLTDALTSYVEGDLRREFDTPAAAARAFDAGTVELTVRTWSESGRERRVGPSGAREVPR